MGTEYGILVSNEFSELAALAEAVMFRLSKVPRPDLVVLDGGRPQLNAVSEAMSKKRKGTVETVAAAKPKGHHSGIAYFLLQSDGRVEFDGSSAAQNMLKILRDDAHDLANLGASRSSRSQAQLRACHDPALDQRGRTAPIAAGCGFNK